jgi:glutamate-1-semialdehyde 2,1-aminomutase
MRVLDYHLPLAVDRAEGARVWDVDGNELIDMNVGYGSLIFGHRSPIVTEAVKTELNRRGTVLGLLHDLSPQVAELIKESFPSVHLLRFTSTGTEAAQTAVRLARAFTKRSHIVLFEGHYHGSSDAVFHRYHAPIEQLKERSEWEAIPGTAGMGSAPREIFVIPWNDTDALRALLEAKGDLVAAVMMEPIMGNAGVIPPSPGFLEFARDATRRCGALLVFDEVITGFRVARGGAQELYPVPADITMLSKALGGGVPVAAIGGRSDIMELVVDGTVFHGGVYSGNPMSLAAALAVQKAYDLNGESIYRHLYSVTGLLAAGIGSIFTEIGIPALIQRVGPMLSCRFVDETDLPPACSYRDVVRMANPKRFIQFQHAAQRAGVYFHPNHLEPWYLSTAHTEEVITTALERLRRAAGAVDWR